MIFSRILIGAGLLGASLDVLLHILQLHDIPILRKLQGHTAIITLLSALLIGASLFAQFNAGALLLDVFIGTLAIISLVTGKELDH